MNRKKKGKSAMDTALDFLSTRARTVRETEDCLDEANFGEYDVYEAVERLKELGYLNDDKFAEEFISTRLASKPLSRRRLREQLFTRKLKPECIDGALAAVTDDMERGNAVQVAEKYWRQFEALDEYTRRQRVMRRLVSRGYDFDVIRDSVSGIIGDVEYVGGEFDGDEED